MMEVQKARRNDFVCRVMVEWARAANVLPPPLVTDSSSDGEYDAWREFLDTESDEDWGQIGSALRSRDRMLQENIEYNSTYTNIWWLRE